MKELGGFVLFTVLFGFFILFAAGVAERFDNIERRLVTIETRL